MIQSTQEQKTHTATDALNAARDLLRSPSLEARRRILLSLNIIYGLISLLSAGGQLAATGHFAYPARDNVMYPLLITTNLASAAYNLLVLRGRIQATARNDSVTRWATTLVLQGTALATVHMNPNTATSFLADHLFACILIVATGVLLGRRAALGWFAVVIGSILIGAKNRGLDFQYHLLTSKEIAALGAEGLARRLDAAASEQLLPLPIGLFAFILVLFALLTVMITYFEAGMIGRVLDAVPSAITKIQLAADLEHKREQDKVRLEAELDLARRVQSALVPARAPVPGYDIASVYRPTLDVGGDCYDIISSRRATWLLIGDVSGHGVSAGLIMMMAQTAVRSAIFALEPNEKDLSTVAVLGVVNQVLRQNVERIGRGQYMTATAFRLDGDVVRYAGLHQDILVYRAATGAVERIETDGVWMGIVDDAQSLLEERTLTLSQGDVMLLHTDGLTEAKAGGTMIGLDRLCQLIEVHAPQHEDAESIVRAIVGDLGAIDFEDDVTLVAVRRTEAA